MTPNYLKELNPNPKDDDIHLDEDIDPKTGKRKHIYTILGKENHNYMSITTYIHTLFEEFNEDQVIQNILNSNKMNSKSYEYYGMNEKDIKNHWEKGKNDGTALHYDIECFYNNIKRNNTSIEWGYFINFVMDHANLVPFRTEFRLYSSSLKICGTIDMLFKNPNGTYDM